MIECISTKSTYFQNFQMNKLPSNTYIYLLFVLAFLFLLKSEKEEAIFYWAKPFNTNIKWKSSICVYGIQTISVKLTSQVDPSNLYFEYILNIHISNNNNNDFFLSTIRYLISNKIHSTLFLLFAFASLLTD